MAHERAKEAGRKFGKRGAYVLVGMAAVVILIAVFQQGERFGVWLYDQQHPATARAPSAQ